MPPLRITREVKRHKPQQKLKEEDYGEKKAHRGRIDWSPGKRFASPQEKMKQASFLLIFPTCSFFNWNMIPGSLLPLFNICQIQRPRPKADTPSLSYQNDITLCSVSEQLVYECRWHEILPRSSIQRCMLKNFPLDLCYANQDLH